VGDAQVAAAALDRANGSLESAVMAFLSGDMDGHGAGPAAGGAASPSIATDLDFSPDKAAATLRRRGHGADAARSSAARDDPGAAAGPAVGSGGSEGSGEDGGWASWIVELVIYPFQVVSEVGVGAASSLFQFLWCVEFFRCPSRAASVLGIIQSAISHVGDAVPDMPRPTVAVVGGPSVGWRTVFLDVAYVSVALILRCLLRVPTPGLSSDRLHQGVLRLA
jgi:hypothetical protein